MTEDEARNWITARFGVSRGTKLAAFVDLLKRETLNQNLIAPSTVDQIWARHIVDSAQLLLHGDAGGKWIDIGSGAGLPGLVIAILRDQPVELIEPRRLRTEFLEQAVRSLSLPNVQVTTGKVERTAGLTDIITARAVAGLDQLFAMAAHRADSSTVWILPRGRNAHIEVEVARVAWQGSFHVEPSITAHDSFIVVARGVRRK